MAYTGLYDPHTYQLKHKDATNTANNRWEGVNTFTQDIQGTALRARWADLAEEYKADADYPIGTLLDFGGNEEVCIAKYNARFVVSEKPAILMNSDSINGTPCALVGRVRVRAIGKIKKHDHLYLSNKPGVAARHGKKTKLEIIALEDNDNSEEKLIMCYVSVQ